MSLAELLPAIRALPKPEQVQLMHLLVDGVSQSAPSQEDELLLAAMFPPGVSFEIATPPDSYEAAATLLTMLEAEKERA